MNITDSAKKQFSEIGGVIRYSLNSGGCSGLKGEWELTESYDAKKDVVMWRSCEDGSYCAAAMEQEEDCHNCPNMFVIDKFTFDIMGTESTIDYTGGSPAWINPTFKVTIPDKNSCGCGESFTL
jgi:Fe-S cluster assembly iron-binding protein IscA